MLFASTDLAARIEAAECRLLTDCVATTALRHPELHTQVLPLAGGVAALAGPGSPLNKVCGLGFDGPLDEAELEAVERAFDGERVPVQVEVSILADPSTAALLTRRGYVLVGFESVLGLHLTAGEVLPFECDAEISPSGPEELNVWLDAVVTGFANPDAAGVPAHEEFPRDALTRVIGDMASTSGFRRYLARRGGQPAGGASLRLSEGVAQLCGAATVPAHRRRGIQTALLSTRLADAAAAGCDLAVVTTQPGSRSQHNVQRRGFSLLYARAILVREPPTHD